MTLSEVIKSLTILQKRLEDLWQDNVYYNAQVAHLTATQLHYVQRLSPQSLSGTAG